MTAARHLREAPATRAMKFIVTLLLVAVLPLGASAAENPPLEGVYVWKGVDVDGTPMNGLVQVVRRGESFLVAWLLHDDDPLPAAVGVGISGGGMFAVLFYGPLTDAIVLYRIEDGGRRLVGRWVAADGDGTIHPDVLTRLADETVASQDMCR